MNLVTTVVETAMDICNNNIKFIIPSYQRPYVWPSTDVQKLLNDIVNACNHNESQYYIGTIMSSIQAEEKIKVYELIDGQQRITTLMLIAMAISEKLPSHPIANLTKIEGEPRLTFKIRDSVEEYLGALAKLEKYKMPDAKTIDDNEFLKGLNTGLRAAKGVLDQLKDDIERINLADYLYYQVKWVNNSMPEKTDLNSLFKRVNTRGIQLEQSDLLKARLLQEIKSDKATYDAIWQSCENMGNYFERNVRALFKASDWNQINNNDLAQYCAEKFKLSTDADKEDKADTELYHENGLTIAEIAKHATTSADGSARIQTSNSKPSEDSNNDETGKVRSIISFALLLMHTYRIYRASKSQEDITSRLHVEQFNKCFVNFGKGCTEEEAKEFIKCLWKVRYQFDLHVVKWIAAENEATPHLCLSTVTKVQEKVQENENGWRLNRTQQETVCNLVQLQAVRYFTGEHSAQYWLTSLLGWLIKQENRTKKECEVLKKIEEIDDVLSLSTDTQKEASFALLTGENVNKKPVQDVCDYLDEPKGTGFEHYWFQKLEYILWKNFNETSPDWMIKKKLQIYRITSKNSVEHVHSQKYRHPEMQLSDEHGLNKFGNLALLSAGENSSYSSKILGEKRGLFLGKPSYDSLKLAHIFHLMGEKEWDQHKIKTHQDAMVNLIKAHYES